MGACLLDCLNRYFDCIKKKSEQKGLTLLQQSDFHTPSGYFLVIRKLTKNNNPSTARSAMVYVIAMPISYCFYNFFH